MTVTLTWDVVPRRLPEESGVRAVEAALAHGGRPELAVDVIFVSDETLTELHGRFLDDPTPTDVITFDLDDGMQGPGAEIYVSVDCAQRVTAERGVALERELALYLVHGALHLCGYDDHDPEERSKMRAAERQVMDALGYEPDVAPHDRSPE